MDRRQFLAGTAGLAASAVAARTDAQPASVPPVKTVRTNTLEIGYHESGPADGFPVLLLHGFPDDAHAYDGVAPILAKAGYRALAIYLRGYGPTRFLDPSAPRTAQQAAIAQDVVDFADALKLPRFAVSGYDWGGRASCITAALHPDRVRAAVLCGGYSIQNTITPGPPASPQAVRNSWYQWYFNTETGRDGLTTNRKALCRYMWQEWSPTWRFTDAMYDQTAASFENPDFVDCVLHPPTGIATSTRRVSRASWTSKSASPRGRRWRCRRSCCTAAMTASASRRQTRRLPSARSSRAWSRVGSWPAPATSCRTKRHRP